MNLIWYKLYQKVILEPMNVLCFFINLLSQLMSLIINIVLCIHGIIQWLIIPQKISFFQQFNCSVLHVVHLEIIYFQTLTIFPNYRRFFKQFFGAKRGETEKSFYLLHAAKLQFSQLFFDKIFLCYRGHILTLLEFHSI